MLIILISDIIQSTFVWTSGLGCSKLTMPLVNVSLKFQTSVSNIRQYVLFKKCEKLKLLSFFFNIFSFFSPILSVYLIIKL